MMAEFHKHVDRSYRRGLVLGLSFAEVFLILLFLLLLVFLALTSALNEAKDEAEMRAEAAESEVQEMRDQLTVIHEIFGNEITPDDFTRLVHGEAQKEKLRQENEALRDRLIEAEADLAQKTEELARSREVRETLEREMHALRKGQVEADALSAQKNEALKRLEEAWEIQEQETQALRETLSSAQKRLAEMEALSAQQDEKLAVYEGALDSLSGEGQDPPCWFVEVADANEPGGLRQRHVKIFDVLISDFGFVARNHDNALVEARYGRIDKGDEGVLPSLPEFILNRELSAAEFENAFRSFYAVGIGKQVRDYSCRFMVDVYDATSPNDKQGYKDALSVVEGIFYMFEESSSWGN